MSWSWKLACMLRKNRSWNPTDGVSKYEFNNNLLGGVMCFWVTSDVTCVGVYALKSNLLACHK